VVATIVSLESGEKALFWESAWLNAMRPKDIAPKIFVIIKKKKMLGEGGIGDKAL
jgi:hypothetical protein